MPTENLDVFELGNIEATLDVLVSLFLMFGVYCVILFVIYCFTSVVISFVLRWRINFTSFFTSLVISLLLAPIIMILMSFIIPPEQGFGVGLIIMILVIQFTSLIYLFEPDDIDSLVSKKIVELERKKRNDLIKIYKGKIKLIITRKANNEEEDRVNEEEIIQCKQLIKKAKIEFKEIVKEQKQGLFNRKKTKRRNDVPDEAQVEN